MRHKQLTFCWKGTNQTIFHKNIEISILAMKKKPTARLTLLQEATERSKLGKTKTNNKQGGKIQWYE
jgi:hypothetical protein